MLGAVVERLLGRQEPVHACQCLDRIDGAAGIVGRIDDQGARGGCDRAADGLGIEQQKDGTLSVNGTRLDSALANLAEFAAAMSRALEQISTRLQQDVHDAIAKEVANVVAVAPE